jgi:hypothetical protein
MRSRDREGMCQVQRQKVKCSYLGAKALDELAEAEEGQDVGVSTEGRKDLGRGGEVGRRIGQNPRHDSATEHAAPGALGIPRADSIGNVSAGPMGPADDKLPGPNRPCFGGEE